MNKKELINHVSEFYRNKLKEQSELKDELNAAKAKMFEIEYHSKETTIVKYKALKEYIVKVENELNDLDKYIKGICVTREVLLNLDFKEVE